MKKEKTGTIFKLIFAVFAILYVIAVVKITFFEDGVRLETSKIKLVPFSAIGDYRAGLKSLTAIVLNYAGNVALFFPAGIFLPVFFKRLNFRKTVAVGAALSLLIEVFQHVLECGYSDVDDLIMNTLGAALGAFIYLYVFNGRKKTALSYVLSLILVVAAEVGAFVGVWIYAPNLLPENMIVINGMIAGKSVDDFDVRVKSYKMSHGEVFIDRHSVTDRDGKSVDKESGSYFISDTALFVIRDEADGAAKYRVVGSNEMIAAIGENSDVRLWLNADGLCAMIMLENNSSSERNSNENNKEDQKYASIREMPLALLLCDDHFAVCEAGR